MCNRVTYDGIGDHHNAEHYYLIIVVEVFGSSHYQMLGNEYADEWLSGYNPANSLETYHEFASVEEAEQWIEEQLIDPASIVDATTY